MLERNCVWYFSKTVFFRALFLGDFGKFCKFLQIIAVVVDIILTLSSNNPKNPRKNHQEGVKT